MMKKPWEEDWGSVKQSTKPWEEDWNSPSSRPVVAGDTKRNYKASEVPGAALGNLPSSVGNLVGGMVGAVKGATKGVVKGALNPADTASYLLNPLDWRRTNDIINAAKAIGGMYADRYGSWDKIKRTVAEDPVGFAADISTIFSGGATAAAKMGATGVSKGLSTAAAVSNPLTLPVKGIEKTASAVSNALDPKSRVYRNALADKVEPVRNALVNPSGREIIPGGKMTAAEIAAPENSTRFAALTEEAKAVLPDEALSLAQAREKAQVARVREVGKTRDVSEAAKLHRSEVTSPMYEEAMKQFVKADEELVNLFSRPSMDKVTRRASELAAEGDEIFQLGKNAPESVVKSSLLDARGRPIETTVPAETAMYPGSSIHYIKMAYDDIIKNPERFGIGAEEARKIGATRDDFLRWAEKEGNLPVYGQARKNYAELSKPIDEMEVAQKLEGALEPAPVTSSRKLDDGIDTSQAEGSASLRKGRFLTMLENEASTIKKSTGQPRHRTWDQIFIPDSLEKIRSVVKDLDRQALVERQAAYGRKAGGGGLKDAVSKGTPDLPPLISPVVTIANRIWRTLKGNIDQRLAEEIAREVLLNPDAVVKSLDKVISKQNLEKRVKGVTNKATRSPAVYNMLSPRSKNEPENALNERW